MYDSRTDLIQPADRLNYSLPISEVEHQILDLCGLNTEREVLDYIDQLEKARIRWACITSKTQRPKNDRWLIEVYENVTKLKPYIENVTYQEPPDRSGKVVSKFSKKSKSRMMDKFRRMKKDDLNLPFFVTLTYHRNEMRGDIAKRHLNTFLQRFRRIAGEKNDFRYFWKMEKQKRGAIHFHLMMWLPDGFFPEKWDSKKRLNNGSQSTIQSEFLKLRVSAAWNEIAEPGDNKHLQAGTNCRPVFSWRMCTGYLSKYMEKEVSQNDFKTSSIVGGFNPRKRTSYQRIEGKRCIKVASNEKIYEKTGRFWGFSNNFDFSAVFKGETDISNINSVKKHLKNIQKSAFECYCNYEKSEINRIKASNLSHKKKKFRIDKILKRFKKQKRRAIVNIEKIEKGAFIQIEVAKKLAFKAICRGG